MTSFRENLLGILYIVACNLLFLCNDTIIKTVNAEVPLGEIIALRGLFATILMTPLVLATGAHRDLRPLRDPWVFWRTVGEIFAAILYLAALMQIPIANANVIGQIAPLTVTAAGALFLGETVGWRRWAAIAAGFLGVVIVVRPGLAGFSVYSLLAVGSAFAVTLRDIATRLIASSVPALFISMVTGIFVGISGACYGFAIGETWVMPQPPTLGLMIIGVVFLIGGYVTSIAFMRHGDISVVAPFRYVVIIWAIIIGYVVFHEVPDAPMLIGMAVIAAAGVYTFSRERSRARLAAEAAAGEGL